MNRRAIVLSVASRMGLVIRIVIVGAIVFLASDEIEGIVRQHGASRPGLTAGIQLLTFALLFLSISFIEHSASKRVDDARRESQRAQDALTQSKARQRELVDQLPHYIFRVDMDDRYTAANAATCRFFGRSESEILDGVVMDLGMPKMSASDLVRSLRTVAPLLPIIAMTGYLDPDVHASVLTAGVHNIIAKPFEIGELLTALRAVL